MAAPIQDFDDDQRKRTKKARATPTTSSGKGAKQKRKPAPLHYSENKSDEARCLWEVPRFSIKELEAAHHHHLKRTREREARTARHEHKRDGDAGAHGDQHGAVSNPIDVDNEGPDDMPTSPAPVTTSSSSSSSSSSSLSATTPPPAANPGSLPAETASEKGPSPTQRTPVLPLGSRAGVSDTATRTGFAVMAARAVIDAYERPL